MVGVAQGLVAISSVDISSGCSVITFRGPCLGTASHWSQTNVQGGWVAQGCAHFSAALSYVFFPCGPPWLFQRLSGFMYVFIYISNQESHLQVRSAAPWAAPDHRPCPGCASRAAELGWVIAARLAGQLANLYQNGAKRNKWESRMHTSVANLRKAPFLPTPLQFQYLSHVHSTAPI